jgi:hypothetical protein
MEFPMSYRNIEVNGQTFKYSVGRSHVKISGDGFSRVYTKAEIGQPIAHRDDHVVTPRNIRDVIIGKPGPRTFVCDKHGTETVEVDFDPLSAEIDRKMVIVPACDECLNEMSWEI